MDKYEQYLEEYRKTHNVNMWNDEVVRDLMEEFNLSYPEAFEIRKNWFSKYEMPRLRF